MQTPLTPLEAEPETYRNSGTRPTITVTFAVLILVLCIVKMAKTMTTYNYFIGIDIGKTTNAICVIDIQENRRLELSIPNTKAGMQSLLDKLIRLPDFSLSTTLFCMEHTGIYCRPTVGFFYALGHRYGCNRRYTSSIRWASSEAKPIKPMPD